MAWCPTYLRLLDREDQLAVVEREADVHHLAKLLEEVAQLLGAPRLGHVRDHHGEVGGRQQLAAVRVADARVDLVEAAAQVEEVADEDARGEELDDHVRVRAGAQHAVDGRVAEGRLGEGEHADLELVNEQLAALRERTCARDTCHRAEQ